MSRCRRAIGVRSKRALALLAGAAALAFTTPARAYHEGEERIVDATAHTLRAREARIGLWEIEVGPVAFATIGTDTAPWAASILVDSVVENGHAKLRVLRTEPLTVSVAAAAYHVDLSATGRLVAGSGSLLLVPTSVFVSSDLSSRLSLHLGATYAHLAAGDVSLDVGSSRARGAISASAVQLHAMGEYRLTRVVALLLQFHAQPYATPATVRMTTTDVVGDKIGFAGTVEPVDRTAVSALASLAISGRNFNVRFGGGYGAVFVPSMGIMVPIATIQPQIDAYVRF